MHSEGFFFQAFVYLTATVISVPIAKRLGLGSVLGYLIAGVAIGPFVGRLIGEKGQDVMHFAEFGVVMMLFLIGLELQPSLLWRMRGPILGLGGLQITLTTAAITGIAYALDMPWQTALALGLILSLSSTAIVLQTLQEKGLMKTHSGQSSFAVLLFQDIAVIPILAVLPLLAIAGDGSQHAATTGGHTTTWVETLPAWAQTAVVLAAVLIIVVGGRFLMRPFFRIIAKTRLSEVFTAAALLLVIGIALLMSAVGLSPALGTFLAGVVLADSEYRHELEGSIAPFKALLLGLFFISVGASIDFGLIGDQPGFIAAMVAGLLVIKFVVLFILGRIFKMGLDQNTIFAFALAQGGEFAFVLFSFASQNGVLPVDITSPLVAVVALSMALTPLLMLLNEKLLQPRFGTKETSKREADSMQEENPVIIAGFGRFGNVVGRLLKANGVEATFLDIDSDHVEILRKLGIKVFYGDASRLDLLKAAGADKARVLILAIDDHEKIIEMVEIAKKHFPDLHVMARASGLSQAYDLLEVGVEDIYRETVDTSLRMGTDVLKHLGYRSFHAHRSSLAFRRHDDTFMRELAAVRKDTTTYLSHAKQRIKDLEKIILSEQKGHDLELDAAWDPESRRQEMEKMQQKE